VSTTWSSTPSMPPWPGRSRPRYVPRWRAGSRGSTSPRSLPPRSRTSRTCSESPSPTGSRPPTTGATSYSPSIRYPRSEQMPLPAPNLDDRRFQDFVDDAKRLIQRRIPAWTDHNVHDPGRTLIEAVATIADQLGYRLNQVPERHYRKFLDLLGITLRPPAAARADLTFRLSAPRPEPPCGPGAGAGARRAGCLLLRCAAAGRPVLRGTVRRGAALRSAAADRQRDRGPRGRSRSPAAALGGVHRFRLDRVRGGAGRDGRSQQAWRHPAAPAPGTGPVPDQGHPGGRGTGRGDADSAGLSRLQPQPGSVQALRRVRGRHG